MRYVSFFKVVLSGFIVLFLAASCVKEGPMGLPGVDGEDGADGMDGVNGEVACMACHSSNSIESIQAQFVMSVHNLGPNVAERGTRTGCAQCHSHEGFVQYAVLDSVIGPITSATAWQCNTCHGIHESFETSDYALRLNDPVEAIATGRISDANAKITYDLLGSNNLCANCHQSRAAEPNVADPGAETFYVSSTHYGPHYSTQANIVAGKGMAEIEGSLEYPTSNYHLNEQASCTGCHMGELSTTVNEEGDPEYSGGHTWKPSVASCNTCHDNNDFNYNGRQADVEAKLVQIQEKLLEFGILAGDEVEGYHPVKGTYDMVLVRAYFNWKGIKEDRSYGVHNPRYVNALLVNTLEALNAYVPASEV